MRELTNTRGYRFVTLVAVILLGVVAQPVLADEPMNQLDFESLDSNALIQSFTAEADPTEPEVVFHWDVSSEHADEELVCSLNADGRGIIEYTFEDCEKTTEQTHRYDEPGEYTARLIVRNRDGESQFASVRVRAPSRANQ